MGWTAQLSLSKIADDIHTYGLHIFKDDIFTEIRPLDAPLILKNYSLGIINLSSVAPSTTTEHQLWALDALEVSQ